MSTEVPREQNASEMHCWVEGICLAPPQKHTPRNLYNKTKHVETEVITDTDKRVSLKLVKMTCYHTASRRHDCSLIYTGRMRLQGKREGTNPKKLYKVCCLTESLLGGFGVTTAIKARLTSNISYANTFTVFNHM